MTPRERVLAVLSGEMPDRVPFVVWNNKLPNAEITGQLLELQTCVINKSTVYRFTTPEVKIETRELEVKEGFRRVEKIYHTPSGALSTTLRLLGSSTWIERMPFGGAGDYDALEAFIASKVYEGCYDDFVEADLMYPGQSLARPETIYTPIQDLICKYMGVEAFCIEWADRRERLLGLCEVIAEDRRKRLELVAASPARFAVIEGNVISEVVGAERFEKYHVPYIEEGCRILHENGKWAGAHLDANNRSLAAEIARTSLDLVESFTPPPDCDLGLAEARRQWPGKTIQINFPSSVHLNGAECVREAARDIIREAAPGDRFIVGVSEDISEGGVDTLIPLAESVLRYGQTPISTN